LYFFGLNRSFRLELAHELVLLVFGLETTVTELGRSVDELEGDLLEGGTGSLRDEGFSQGENPLPASGGGALDHEEVLVDDTVVREATHGGDGLLGEVDGGGAAVLVVPAPNSVDLLVNLSPVMVTVLTSSGNGPLDSTRMPGSNTSNLSKTFVSLSRKTSGSPTSGDAFEPFTLGDADDIDHLVLFKEGRDRDGLLKEPDSELDLLGDGSSVDLDLHEVGLLLPEIELSDLGVAQQANDGTLALDAFEVLVDGVLFLVALIFPRVSGEGQLLGGVPILVISPSNFLAQMLSPDGR